MKEVPKNLELECFNCIGVGGLRSTDIILNNLLSNTAEQNASAFSIKSKPAVNWEYQAVDRSDWTL